MSTTPDTYANLCTVTERKFSDVNIESWSRRAAYEFFQDFRDPFFNFSANIDVTPVYRFAKENALSFALSVLHCSLVAGNRIREFRMRHLSDGRLVEFEKIHATQTILNDDETFSFAYFEMKNDIFEFDRSGKTAMTKYKALKTFDVETDRLDLIYYSVIPWVSFTSFKHASRLEQTRTIPRIVFGKIFDDTDHKLMPMSVEVNHIIMDGIHVGKFFNYMQDTIDTYSPKG